MANTNKIRNAQTESLPKFPILAVGKTKRLVTKHFTNLALWLQEDQLALMNYLIYQTQADNTFVYSTKLLVQYSNSMYAAQKEYSSSARKPSVGLMRLHLEALIRKGMIFQTGVKNKLMISPMLTYCPDIINSKQYNVVQEMYQVSSPEKIHVFTDYFSKLVKQFLESKKKNYTYGKNR